MKQTNGKHVTSFLRNFKFWSKRMELRIGDDLILHILESFLFYILSEFPFLDVLVFVILTTLTSSFLMFCNLKDIIKFFFIHCELFRWFCYFYYFNIRLLFYFCIKYILHLLYIRRQYFFVNITIYFWFSILL